MRAVAPNNIDLCYAVLLETIKNFVSIKTAPTWPQNGPTLLVNIFDQRWRKFDPIILNVGVATLITPLDSKYFSRFVGVVQSHN